MTAGEQCTFLFCLHRFDVVLTSITEVHTSEPWHVSKVHTRACAEQHSCGMAWQGMAFGWEAVMTFVLVAVVYAVAIGKPSFSETGPLAVGFSLWASAIVGKL